MGVILKGVQPLPMGKCHRSRSRSVSLVSLGPDELECIVEALGLHAVVLRQTCKAFADLHLPPGVALALKVLQAGPSVPLHMHMVRRTTRACTLSVPFIVAPRPLRCQ